MDLAAIYGVIHRVVGGRRRRDRAVSDPPEDIMEWDLGIRGVGLLLAMSVGFGLLAQVLMWRSAPHWMWLVATATYFASGVFVSEAWFGWATEEDLQPNIDGLSFDEVLLLAPLIGLPVLVAAWLLTRRFGARQRRMA